MNPDDMDDVLEAVDKCEKKLVHYINEELMPDIIVVQALMRIACKIITHYPLDQQTQMLEMFNQLLVKDERNRGR